MSIRTAKVGRVVWAAVIVLLMIVLASIFSAISRSVVRDADARSNLEKDIQDLANALNRSAPDFFNDGSRIDRYSVGPGPRLNHYVSMPIPYDRSVAGRMAEFERSWAENICSHPTFRAAVNDGVLLVYHFRYADGATLPPITLDKESCRGITVKPRASGRR